MINGIFQFFQDLVHELRSGVHAQSRNSRPVFLGTESIINLGVKLWNTVTETIKSSESLNVFKSKIKQCPYRVFKAYIDYVGLINLNKCYENFIHFIYLIYVFFNDKIFKILFKVIETLYPIIIVPYNVLLYLALIRPAFCIGAKIF